jgi:hypothetical protein
MVVNEVDGAQGWKVVLTKHVFRNMLEVVGPMLRGAQLHLTFYRCILFFISYCTYSIQLFCPLFHFGMSQNVCPP